MFSTVSLRILVRIITLPSNMYFGLTNISALLPSQLSYPVDSHQLPQKNARMYLLADAMISMKISVENKLSKTYGAALADVLSIITSFWWNRRNRPSARNSFTSKELQQC